MFSMLPGSVYPDRVKTAALEALLENGAWLLLSIDHYNWRARYDLARALLAGRPTIDTHHGRHIQSMVDLEIQSGIYSATEQLLRLVMACRAHRHGTEEFFETYVRWGTVVPLIREAQEISRPELGEILLLPEDKQSMLRILRPHIDDADEDLAQHALQRVNHILNEIYSNIREFRQLTDRPEANREDLPFERGHGLRSLDNAYRHGLKALFPDTLPAARTFDVFVHGLADPIGPFAVDLYLSQEEPSFGTVDGRPDRTEANLEALGHICLRIKQFVRAFLGTRILDEPGALLTMTTFDLDKLTPDLE